MSKEQVLMRLVRQNLEARHYAENTIDDNFSKKVFKEYTDIINFRKLFLTEGDFNALKAFETKIDDEMMGETYQLFDLSLQIRDKRRKEAQSYYKEILAQPFDFAKDETFETDVKKIGLAKNEAEIKERWRQYLKYDVLRRVAGALEAQEKSKDSKTTPKTFEQIEAEARKGTARVMDDFFLRMEKEEMSSKRATYINAITACYDPHTNYFAPRERQEFVEEFSGRYEGIGARLQKKEDGTIKVSEVIPGGPAFRNGVLKAEDIILKVAQADGEPVEITNMLIEDAVKLIKGKKATEVRLTVRRLDGTTAVVPIVRDVVVIEETYAKSVIVTDKDKKKIGYINLPGFYADFSETGGRNCGEDVKEEIRKLKAEGAEGIVLDLRNNGGGSLDEVVKMTGLFIEDGPVVQVKGRKGSPQIRDDEDDKIEYDGALVVMVNSFSASASEILAGAIQDYKRGVIIGSKSTYGKGTVQAQVDLDRFLPASFDNIKPLGAITLTIQKFYRINGTTNQLTGVIPDIILPDLYNAIEVGEKEQDYPLAADKIDPLKYKVWTKNESKIAKAKEKSAERIAKDEVFKLINENAQRIRKQNDNSEISLNLEKFRSWQKQLNDEGTKFKAISDYQSGIEVMPLKADFAKNNADSLTKSRIDFWHKSIKKDIQLSEAIAVIKEMM
ncbi:MAG: PDZ domain-containing protein [Cytophagales bacterium]|nr:MAG: PDZ domain-containing protein [Cytophagales bacterium]